MKALNATEAAVYAHLLERADAERRAWPTVRELAAFTGCHERNVRKALKALAASGRLSTTALPRGALLPSGETVRASQQLLHTLAPPTRQMHLPGVPSTQPAPTRAAEPSPQLTLCFARQA